MKDFTDMESWSPKKLRTLRNRLNNRLESFKNSGEKAKELQKGHALVGLDQNQCEELLEKVKKLLVQSK